MAIIKGRQQAIPDKPFALFLIGMRVNNLLAVHRWSAVARAMTRMQAELAKKPDAGLLWQKNFLSGRITLLVQYWDSMEKLFAFAHDREGTLHLAFIIKTTDVTGTASSELRIAIPGGFTAAFRVDGGYKYHDNGAAPLDGVYSAAANATYVSLYKPNAVNWTLTSADNTDVYGVVTIPVN